MKYIVKIDVDYGVATDEATLLQDINTIITRAFESRAGVVGFQIESVGLEELEGGNNE